MYKRTDKKRLYELIDLYLSNKISEATFCYEFYCSFDLELDYDTLEEDEYKAFYELSEITCRFSEFEKDIKSYPGVYRTKEEVKNKIKSTKEQLKKYFSKFKEDSLNQGDMDV